MCNLNLKDVLSTQDTLSWSFYLYSPRLFYIVFSVDIWNVAVFITSRVYPSFDGVQYTRTLGPLASQYIAISKWWARIDEMLDDLEESGCAYDYCIHGEMYIPCKTQLDRRCRRSCLVTTDARSMCYNISLRYSRRRRQVYVDSFGKINILSWSC